MQNQETNVKKEIANAKERLELLEDLDLLESEFRLIQNEYLQRRRDLEMRLAKLAAAAAKNELQKSA